MLKFLLMFWWFTLIFFITLPSTAWAITDPASVPNNKYGIHIITTNDKEIDSAKELVNSSGGDWGYVTIIIESYSRDQLKWQKFFDKLRNYHLIPIVRLATSPDGDTWKKPYEGEETAWADFLDSLNWPTKLRYVTIYNEPNHATEWGGSADPEEYAKVLDKTIDALKKKNPDFFVLNAGLDASAPQKTPAYYNEETYLNEMNQSVPGIFDKLDGWVSHSYPNPGFLGKPADKGRGTVRTWQWELDTLKKLGVTKNLPVFITETGWKHSQGDKIDNSLPSHETIGQYYNEAFADAWNTPQIITVTPFLLNYQSYPFDHFSFTTQEDVGFHPHYFALQSIPKQSGRPIKENKAELNKGEIYKTVVSGETYQILLTFKNTGQSIWNEYDNVQLFVQEGSKELGLLSVKIPADTKIEPGQTYTFEIVLKAPQSGSYKTVLNLYSGGKQFDSEPFEFITEVKETPAQTNNYLLKVLTLLNKCWKTIA